jgi:hypothetical protein
VIVSLLVFFVVVLRSPDKSAMKASSYIPLSSQILNMRSILCFTFSSLKNKQKTISYGLCKQKENLKWTEIGSALSPLIKFALQYPLKDPWRHKN